MKARAPSSHAPSVLLVTQGDPRSSGVGELFLSELASHYPPGRLVRYSLVAGATDGLPDSWLGCRSVARRVEYSACPVLSSWRQHVFARQSLPRIGEEIDDLVRREHIDLIWVVLNSGNMIYLAERLSAGRTPMVGLVWDDPDYLARSHHLDPWAARRLLRAFSSVLGRLRRVALASDGMATLYASKYGVQGIVMTHGIHPVHWRSVRTHAAPAAHCTVGFAGSLYCKREWNSLVAALRDWNRKEPTKVKVRFIGRFPRLGARSAPFVETVGVLSLEDTLAALASTDVAYVPYWFDRRHAWAAQTAFPSKISACVAAGVPILFHGPRRSSPADFLRRHPVGLSCHSLRVPELQRALRTLLFDQEVRAAVARERLLVLEDRLGSEAMLGRFAELLEIERDQLLPLRAALPRGSSPSTSSSALPRTG